METVLSTLPPRDLGAVGGFLGARFQANRTRRLKDKLLSEQFIRLHEQKHYDDWFWMGEQIGKWLDAVTRIGASGVSVGSLETALAVWVLQIPLSEMEMFGKWSIPILAVMLNVVFVLYDYSMNGLIVLYIRRLHPLVQKYIK